MESNYIKNINIENFKCFKCFEIKNLKRINLISGKNNVGKTAFMEACFLSHTASNIYIDLCDDECNSNGMVYETPGTPYFYFKFIKLLLVIKQNRKGADFIIQWLREEVDLGSSEVFNVNIDGLEIYLLNGSFIFSGSPNSISFNDPIYHLMHRADERQINISNFRENKYYHKIYKKNHPPILNNKAFISTCADTNIQAMLDDLKLKGKYSQINDYLNEIFQIDQVDIINNTVMLQKNKKFRDISEFGDGLRHFLNIVLALLSNEDTVIYLDEVDNGIHYSLFDRLWEIILTTSNDKNVQVFATTHSQECIESYSRVANKLKDKDIAFLEIFEHKNQIKSILLDSEMLTLQLDQNHKVRG